MKAYRLRIWSVVCPEAWRDVLATSWHTLADLHECLRASFELRGDCLWGFFAGGRPWEDRRHYGGPGTGAPHPADKALLGHLRLKAGRRLLYLYDYHEEIWHAVDVMEVREMGQGPVVPFVLDSSEVVTHLDYSPFGPDRPLGPRRPRERRRFVRSLSLYLTKAETVWRGRLPCEFAYRCYELASNFMEWCEYKPGRFLGIGLAARVDLVSWVLTLCRCLLGCGFYWEPFCLSREAARLVRPDLFGAMHVVVLAGRERENAATGILEVLARFPDRPEVLALCGQAWERIGASEEAARCRARALELAGRQGEPEAVQELLEDPQDMEKAFAGLARPPERRVQRKRRRPKGKVIPFRPRG